MKSIISVFLTICVASLVAKYTGPTNQAGIDIIKRGETCYRNFHLDRQSIKTIGCGHSCEVYNCSVPLNGKYNVPLTKSDAEALFAEDLAFHENCINKVITYPELTENQFSALVSLTFRLSCVALGTQLNSDILEKVNKGDIAGAAALFQTILFAHPTGRYVPTGLFQRRLAEKALFCTGVDCAPVPNIVCTAYAEEDLVLRRMPNPSQYQVKTIRRGTQFNIIGTVNGTDKKDWLQVEFGRNEDNLYTPATGYRIEVSNNQPWCPNPYPKLSYPPLAEVCVP